MRNDFLVEVAKVKYPEYAVFDPACVQTAMICVLLENNAEAAQEIIQNFNPTFSSVEDFFQHLDKLLEPKYAVQYNGTDGASMEWA